MRTRFIALLAILMLPVLVAGQTAKSPYGGFKYDGVRPDTILPNGVKHLGGGLIGDFDADPVYGISRVSKGKTTMLWLESSTGRDATGVTGWQVLDVLTFPTLTPTQHLAFALDPAVSCKSNGRDIAEDLVVVGQVSRRLQILTPQRAWTADLKSGKFVPRTIEGLKCLYSEP